MHVVNNVTIAYCVPTRVHEEKHDRSHRLLSRRYIINSPLRAGDILWSTDYYAAVGMRAGTSNMFARGRGRGMDAGVAKFICR